jgi:uncharacterized Zn finger protein
MVAAINFDNYVPLSIAITIIGITFCLINSYREFDNVVMERQIDTTRVHEGLPTDITLTPEDFRTHPELVEIFGLSDTDNNLHLILESNEHFEEVQNQFAAIDYNALMTIYEIVDAFLSSLF